MIKVANTVPVDKPTNQRGTTVKKKQGVSGVQWFPKAIPRVITAAGVIVTEAMITLTRVAGVIRLWNRSGQNVPIQRSNGIPTNRKMVHQSQIHWNSSAVMQILPSLRVALGLGLHMMTSSNGNIFHVTGYLCGKSPVNSPHKRQWRGTWMFSLICARINCWVNNREAGDLRRLRAHYDVIVMEKCQQWRPKS